MRPAPHLMIRGLLPHAPAAMSTLWSAPIERAAARFAPRGHPINHHVAGSLLPRTEIRLSASRVRAITSLAVRPEEVSR